MDIETKFIGGTVISTKQENRNGVPIGIVEGYIATWDIDRGDYSGIKDQFTRGAFADSISSHKEKNRPIRLKDHHGRTVGGFPIEKVFEDERGLFGVGEINLDVQQGREAFALAKQGVLSDFSIGFSINESNLDEQEGIRTITMATIWEGSIVDEPMNPHANIVAVKALKKSDINEVKEFTERDLEKALIKSGAFSKEAAKFIVSKCSLETKEIEAEKDESKAIIAELNSLKALISEK